MYLVEIKVGIKVNVKWGTSESHKRTVGKEEERTNSRLIFRNPVRKYFAALSQGPKVYRRRLPL